MLQITPYAGWGLLFIDIRSQVIDETPYLVSDSDDQQGSSATVNGSLYSFPAIEWKTNSHNRIYIGSRFTAAMVEIILEWNTTLVKPKTLHTFSLKLGFDV